MANMTYTVKSGKEQIAKCDSPYLASHIANILCNKTDKKIRIIDNVFSRVAFFSNGLDWNQRMIEEMVLLKSSQFREEYDNKYRTAGV